MEIDSKLVEQADTIRKLIKKLLAGNITEEERNQLDTWLKASDRNQQFFNGIMDKNSLRAGLQQFTEDMEFLEKGNVLSSPPGISSLNVPGTVQHTHRVHFLKTAWFRYAAIILLLVGSGVYLWQRSSFRPVPDNAPVALTDLADVPAGRERAVLTLSDGSIIILDSAANGNLANQGNIKIIKPGNGQLAYHFEDSPENGRKSSDVTRLSGPDEYNTITTPKGGQYQITLPDGTKVWLNAASSIRFPTGFVQNRNITITGEVYFEVAPHKSNSFSVVANNILIEALGTSFNVNAYADEPFVQTTLLEGAVRVARYSANRIGEKVRDKEAVVLAPGQQAVIKDTIQVNKKINAGQVMAWKDGTFNFQDKRLKEVMRTLARWYDVSVKLEPGAGDPVFWGDMPMNLSLRQVLKVLEGTGLHFKLEEGSVLHVMP